MMTKASIEHLNSKQISVEVKRVFKPREVKERLDDIPYKEYCFTHRFKGSLEFRVYDLKLVYERHILSFVEIYFESICGVEQ